MSRGLFRWLRSWHTDLVRMRMFDRKPRVRPGTLPYLDAHQQAVYAQACANLQAWRPTTPERERT